MFKYRSILTRSAHTGFTDLIREPRRILDSNIRGLISRARPEHGRMYVLNRTLRSRTTSPESRGDPGAPANPGFHLFPKLIYDGRRISGLPRVNRANGRRACFLSPTSSPHCLPPCEPLAHTRQLIHAESYDLDSNFCETDRTPPLLAHGDVLFFLRLPFLSCQILWGAHIYTLILMYKFFLCPFLVNVNVF